MPVAVTLTVTVEVTVSDTDAPTPSAVPMPRLWSRAMNAIAVSFGDDERVRRLQPPTGPVRMVLDTDAYNEIDDQYALAYALLARERLRLEAIYAAPFHNDRSDGPEDGMLRSRREILRVLDRMGRSPEGWVYEGSRSWLPSAHRPVPSPAVNDLIARARTHVEPAGDGGGFDSDRGEGLPSPLYVVAIGAATNVASALLTAPDIAERIVVVWLGGNPSYWDRAVEFNVQQDMHAARVLFDSGVPLVHVPCRNVTQHLSTTQPEIEAYVRPAGELGAYLADIFADFHTDHFARSKVLWDVGAIAWLVDPTWTPSVLTHSPLLTDQGTWSHDPSRHLMREVRWADRDSIFADLFRRLAA